MSPVFDTVAALYAKAPDAFAAWLVFCLLPMVVPAALVLFAKRGAGAKFAFVLSAAARLMGWPVLFLALVGVPLFVLEVFLMPVILDAYPASRTLLSVPLAFMDLLIQNLFWLVPLLWLVWVFFGTIRFRRAWNAS